MRYRTIGDSGQTTACVASDLGYEVDFVTEATLTFPTPHPEADEELSADEVVRRTEYALRNRFARITTVGGLLAELRGETEPDAARCPAASERIESDGSVRYSCCNPSRSSSPRRSS